MVPSTQCEKESHVSPDLLARADNDCPRPLRPAPGVYDPEQARIEAESCHKINEKYAANQDATFRTRAVAIKENRADLVKHHLDVLWHDYFKPEHLEAVLNLHELYRNATKQVSKVKASTDAADSKALLDMIDEIDAAWKKTGGEEKTRAAAAFLQLRPRCADPEAPPTGGASSPSRSGIGCAVRGGSP